MQILIVEDETRMAALLEKGLRAEGHAVMVAYTGASAVETAQNCTFDVIVLDVMLPGFDGFEVVRRLRERRNQTPVLMLTARDAPLDKVKGLDIGADDYLTKPFLFNELVARLRAVSRRGPIPRPAVLKVADLTLNPATHQVFRNKRPIELTLTEFSLLELLMRNAGRVLERDAIIAAVWNTEESGEDSNLNAFISLLRQKIDKDDAMQLIQTVRGVGYRVGRGGE
ncbi:MAG: DNA-binding response regulator [Acidobacteriales bacterium 59-55]|nr:response regulator transcription factor [Terriglobales bacterium]OJV41893.1 MAG: DNA-binding response regulator [Acidobacteriales bacterium 59-55]